MHTWHDAPLAERTTLRLGGPARTLVEVETEAELIDALREGDAADEGARLVSRSSGSSRGEATDNSVLVLGGGSNVVIADEGFDGTVIAIRTQGIETDDGGCGSTMVRVAAGVDWDDFVVTALEKQWRGVEALSGIPGLVGATPIQNVGAYGQEVAETIASVRVWDRRAGEIRTIPTADCDFSYRNSRFKADPQAMVVLSVTFQFRQGDLSMPIKYAELAGRLGVQEGDCVPQQRVREAVLDVRRSKGMVLDPSDHDTWSAGSFFTNPILDAAQADSLPDGAPRFEQPDGRVKTSAAWLIGHAGFSKGDRRGAVGLSGKHVLAMTNRGGGTTAELLELAREVRDAVQEKTGVRLVNEPVTVGCRL